MADMPVEKFENILAEPSVMPSTAAIVRRDGEPAQVDKHSLRVWGLLQSFEREEMELWQTRDLLDGMVITMRDDVRVLLPHFIHWLMKIQEELNDRPIERVQYPNGADQRHCN